jgi:putative lipoic acid-binding regulatory protein
MQIDAENKVIVYPCQWSYRVIGRDREGVREAVEVVLSGREFLLYYSKSSTGGKYHSWNIDLVVCDEEERNAIFGQLSSHPAIMMVI